MPTNSKDTRADYIFRKVVPKDGRIRVKAIRPTAEQFLAHIAGDSDLSSHRHKFRSDFELGLARKLAEAQVNYEYETHKVPYQPKIKNYTPDFWFPEYGFFVEAKGKFDTADRAKHLLIKKQNPDIDIRFVFMRARNKIRKGSKTTYAMWCEKHGFMWAEGSVPVEWFNER
jgi:hypothetical protein